MTINNNPKAVIFGISGECLTEQEIMLIKKHNPLGFIIFSRNIKNPSQLSQLTSDLRKLLDRKILPILVDQEGGRVARLKEPFWRHPPKASVFRELAQKNLELAKRASYLNSLLIAHDLRKVGIDTNCAPMLDILFTSAHDIVGDRSFGSDRETVVALAEQMIKGFREIGVQPILKHIPGHGRATVDSHLKLPIVSASYSELYEQDFFPFTKLKDQSLWAMTAHITYEAIDTELPATFSPKVINMIRNDIGFKSLIITDCITMQALSGTLVERTKKSFAAGCDVVLLSKATTEEMSEVAETCPQLTDIQWQKLATAYTPIVKTESYLDNISNIEQELAHILQQNTTRQSPIAQDPTENTNS